MLSFLHSADWQIGQPYARVKDPDKRARLRQVRLEALKVTWPSRKETLVTTGMVFLMSFAAALFFFIVGGIEALIIRIQLAQPDGSFVSESTYNQVFTMHGVTMIFLVIMPDHSNHQDFYSFIKNKINCDSPVIS